MDCTMVSVDTFVSVIAQATLLYQGHQKGDVARHVVELGECFF
jgi:hypothetical protein